MGAGASTDVGAYISGATEEDLISTFQALSADVRVKLDTAVKTAPIEVNESRCCVRIVYDFKSEEECNYWLQEADGFGLIARQPGNKLSRVYRSIEHRTLA